MGRTQKAVLAGASALTLLALGSFLAGAPAAVVRTLDALTSAALFAVALAVPKPFVEQRLISVALGLSALGDLFLTRLLPVPAEWGNIAGMACFLLAYVVLTRALLRGRPRPVEALLVLPYVGVGTAVVWLLSGVLDGVFRVAVPVFLLVITTMAWSAATTLTRDHFVARVRWWAAAGAATIFASDAAVAFEMFHPLFAPTPPAWLQVFVRASYAAGWLLLLLIVCDPVLRAAPAWKHRIVADVA